MVYLEQRKAIPNGDHWWSGVGPGRVTARMWRRVDGKTSVFEDNGSGFPVHPHSGAFAVVPSQLDVRRLPTDPDALLARIGAAGAGSVESRRQATFTAIAIVLRENILPPRLQAAIYQALPKIPGVLVEQDVVDAAGRHGVAFARVTSGSLDFPLRRRFELILDRKRSATWACATSRRTMPPRRMGGGGSRRAPSCTRRPGPPRRSSIDPASGPDRLSRILEPPVMAAPGTSGAPTPSHRASGPALLHLAITVVAILHPDPKRGL